MSYEAPFEGLRVVDLSQGIAGPYCAMLLAQHGADVIKVEPPGGDWSRTLGIRYGDQTAYSIAGNLGKRSIVVDMSTALFTFQAVSAALYARMREPRGRYLQASLMQAGAALQTVNMIANHLEGGVMRPGLTPSGTFSAKDGWLNITVLRNEEFPALCDAIERPDLAADPRFADNDARFRHVGALTETLSETLRQRAVAEWSERLQPLRWHPAVIVLVLFPLRGFTNALFQVRIGNSNERPRLLMRSTGRSSSGANCQFDRLARHGVGGEVTCGASRRHSTVKFPRAPDNLVSRTTAERQVPESGLGHEGESEVRGQSSGCRNSRSAAWCRTLELWTPRTGF